MKIRQCPVAQQILKDSGGILQSQETRRRVPLLRKVGRPLRVIGLRSFRHRDQFLGGLVSKAQNGHRELFFEDRGVNELSQILLLHPRGGDQQDFPFADVDSTGDFSGSFGEKADGATVEKQFHTVTGQLRVPQHIYLAGVQFNILQLVENFLRVKPVRGPGPSWQQDDGE